MFESLNIIGVLLNEHPTSKVVIEGHTDNQPINNARFPDPPPHTGVGNYALSAARAMSVANYFVEEFNFNRNFIDAIPRGELQPIGDNNTSAGRAQNRRVEIRIYLDYNTALNEA
jgi:chemotaxis protein MotB